MNVPFLTISEHETPVPLGVPLRCFMLSLIKHHFYNMPMSKQQYRSEMGIIADILGVTMDGGIQGVIVSAISRRANLSHYAVLEKCQKLIDAGLVESMKDDRNRLFKITEKGIKFFQEFQRFQGVVQGLNLRY
ncbi:MAG: winged helix-turn-helix domain-containing protein [Nitrosotalea sp.]